MEANFPLTSYMDAQKAISSDDVRAVFKFNLELAPSYCPTCDAIYCSEHWHVWPEFDTDDNSMMFDCTRGRCPQGHVRMLED